MRFVIFDDLYELWDVLLVEGTVAAGRTVILFEEEQRDYLVDVRVAEIVRAEGSFDIMGG